MPKSATRPKKTKKITRHELTKQPETVDNHPFGTLCAAAGGIVGPFLYLNSGVSTALHEEVGHGLLGMRLTHNYPSGSGPEFWIGGFEHINKIGSSDSPAKNTEILFSWLFQDHAEDGRIGWARNSSDAKPNALGQHLGADGTSAWISIAGSVPGLFVNTLLVSFGMSIRKKHPRLALGLIIFGLENHIIESSYSWTAATMSNSELHENAKHGHDFANFAVKMSSITGTSPKVIAISTAVAWTCFVPLVGLGIYFYQRSKQVEIVPDMVAINFLLCNPVLFTAKERQKIIDLKNKYLAYCISEDANWRENVSFYSFLQANIEASLLKKAKRETLKNWQSIQAPTLFQKTLAFATFLTILTAMLTQILGIFAITTTPALLPVVHALQPIIPILGLTAIINSIYETTNDFKCPDKHVPALAKTLSVINLCLTICIVALTMIATFVPDTQLIIYPVIFIGSMLSLWVNFQKVNSIQAAFKESFAIQFPPDTEEIQPPTTSNEEVLNISSH